jgi:hypothetical protein
MDAINSELTRAGLQPRRADLVSGQQVRYRNQMRVRQLSRGPSAA